MQMTIMKGSAYRSFLILSLCLSTAILGCSDDENPVNDLDKTLSGTYRLVSLTDKIGDIGAPPGTTFIAGEAFTFTQNSISISFTITGTLTLTETRYTFNFAFTVTVLGQSETETDTDTGTYSIQGSTITIVSDDPEDNDPETFTFSLDGNQFIMENSESRITFEKL